MLYFKMLQPDFQTSNREDNKQIKKNQHNIRIEYSGGFRQQSLNHLERNKMHEQKKQSMSSGNHILDYLQHINIENLPNLYLSSMPDHSAEILERQRQKQEQATLRLFNNDYPSHKKKQKQQTKEKEENSDRKFAQNVWSLDTKFSQLPNQYVFRKEMLKLHKKIRVQYDGILKKKKILIQTGLNQVFACFLVSEYQKILEKLKSENLQLEIYYMWKGYLSTVNLKTLREKLEKQRLAHNILDRLRKKIKYLFCLIKLPKLKQQQTAIPAYSFHQLCSFMNSDLDFNMQEIKDAFQIQKQYTSPFCIEHEKKTQKKMQNTHKQESNFDEEIVTFKANPIPKSTYEGPKMKEKKQFKSTSVKPFKLSQKNQNMTPQEFYQFEKWGDFKAQPIPETTYKPYKPNLLSEEQKKARAIIMLQKAKFPQTMKNLQNYKEFQNNKIEKLAHKYDTSPQKIEISEIPNFNRLHAIQITNLQNKKQQNNANVKVVPFNLSVGKKRQNQMEQIGHFGVPIIHPYSPAKPAKAARSTKKFDTYVKFRNEYAKEKKEKQNEKQKNMGQKEKKKEPYIKIIKERMAQQLQKHPKKSSEYETSQPMKVKVDMIKIYQQKPLLMKSSLPEQQYNLDWEPIF